MPQGIIFDLDGTLVDSLSATFDAFNHGITQFGGRKHSPHEIMAYFGPGEGDIFSKILGPEKGSKALKVFQEFTDAQMGKIPLHSGVGDMLESLKSRGTPVSIVTGRGWFTTEMILKHHGILDRFITVIANDHVSQPKPSPEGIRLALSRMKLEPSKTVYVGDSWMDMRAATAAGSHGVAALWDYMAKREELSKHEPKFYASKPAELLDIKL